ncbi:MAG: type II secretion system F family protein, partial [Dehalococcoidales bacterium]|nr:type II secretion system F family protein [Dehalococcoidales bacterium]
LHGKTVKGTIKATNEVAAERLLIGQGYNPLNLEVAPSMFSLEEALPSLFRVKPRDVIVFSRQLATLLRSGISLLPALEILQDQVTGSRAFKKILETIANDLRSGSSFSQAISKHPKAFSDIYCRTVGVGEQSGSLEMVLNRMADFTEKQGAVAKKIGGALAYPAMMLGAGVVVVIILMTVVMPQLLGMFSSMGADLPLPTKILISLTNFFSENILYILITGVVLVAVVLWMIKQPAGKRILDRIRIALPLVGPPTLMGELARFCRTMSVLISAGLNLQEVMKMIPQSSNNQIIRDALVQVNEGLLLGSGLSEPMSRIGLFPPLLVQMVAVGEESNTLDFTLGVVADFYEVTAEEKTNAMVSMIGPLSTIIIALGVGFIAISILMPMYSLTGTFG